jgi:hypothetical protein
MPGLWSVSSQSWVRTTTSPGTEPDSAHADAPASTWSGVPTCLMSTSPGPASSWSGGRAAARARIALRRMAATMSALLRTR